MATLPTWWERIGFFAVSHAGFSVIHLQARRPPAPSGPPQRGMLAHRSVPRITSAALAGLQTCESCVLCTKSSFELVASSLLTGL